MDYYDASPRPRGYNTPAGRDTYDSLNRELLARAEAVCQRLLPGGKREGSEYKTADLNGGRGHSLSVNLKTGVWKDFATDRVHGHDLISLWASVHGIRQGEAKEEAEKWLGKAPPAPKTERPSWAAASPPSVAVKSELPKPDREWTYVTADGEVFCYVHRIDKPGQRKMVKPVLPDKSDYGKPKDRLAPLLNLPEIMAAQSATVVLVEGEKCVDALLGMVEKTIPTTMIGGSAATQHTDWSPLKGRHIVRWPDKDDAGVKWLASTMAALQAAGVASVRDVIPDTEWKAGEDAADRNDAERRYFLREALKAAPAYERPVKQRAYDQNAEYMIDEPLEEIEWLVDGLFQAGRGGLFAAAGGTGKGFLLLDLAVKVATPPYDGYDADPTKALGHLVKRHGNVQILSAEDTRGELQRRMRKIHPGLPREVARRLFIRPYPDMKDVTPHLFIDKHGELRPTDEYNELMEDLATMNLELLIIDPLQAFFGADMTTNVMSQNVAHILDKMAIQLGCTVIAAHHLTKGDRNKPIATPADARNAIQGAGQLTNAVRWAYAIWPDTDEHGRIAAQAAGVPPEKYHDGLVYRGAIVKTNAPTSTEISTFVRSEKTGLLEHVPNMKVREEYQALNEVPGDLSELIRYAVKYLCDAGHPPTLAAIGYGAGKKGFGDWLPLMPEPWRKFKDTKKKSRHSMITDLTNAGLLCQTDGFVHIPGDDWDTGLRNLDTDRRAGKPAAVPWPMPASDDSESP